MVWLVWTRWGGLERGEGRESVLAQVPILPRPKVIDLTSVSFSPFSAGLLPVGSVRLEQVSADLTEDVLTGRMLPGLPYLDMCGAPRLGPAMGPPELVGRTDAEKLSPFVRTESIEQPYEFFYEIVEDRPGSLRRRFRLLSTPFRDAEKFSWSIVLERMSEDRRRDGTLGSDD